MIKLHPSPAGIQEIGHASDRTEVERGGSLGHRRNSKQGMASGARGQSCSRTVLPGSGHSRSPDHGGVGNWSYRRMARPRSIFARRCGVGGIRCGAFRTPVPVRHRCRGARDRLGLLHPTQGAPAMDHGRARTSGSPRTWHGIRKSRNRAAHAKKTISSPGAG